VTISLLTLVVGFLLVGEELGTGTTLVKRVKVKKLTG
jgi:hypothetical protein